jgi:sigma-B regulation protein RsbU (phosphoserine phosphatase)
VLVVDDYAMNVELLAANLTRVGYEVVGAECGDDALAAIRLDAPDVVLMDIVMPGLSGLDVLRLIRGERETADLPVILVSGLGDTGNIVEGLRLGANDYVTKPIDMPILQARLATHTSLKRARDDLKRTAILLAGELERNAQDLAIAGQVQRSILPSSPPRLVDVETAWCYRPATEVGGDLFDVIALPGGRTLLFVADAMGHGVQAALVASTVKATLMAHLDDADDLARLLSGLDRSLESLFEDRFVTAAVCVLDPAAGRLHYALAGHPAILLCGPEGVDSLVGGGVPLGTSLGCGYTMRTVPLPRPSRVLMFSDGLVEAEDADGRQFGIDAVADLFLDASDLDAAGVLAMIRDAMDAHCGDSPLYDDLTILAAHVAP